MARTKNVARKEPRKSLLGSSSRQMAPVERPATRSRGSPPRACTREDHEHEEVVTLFRNNAKRYYKIYDNSSANIDGIIPYSNRICHKCSAELKYYLTHFAECNTVTPWTGKERPSGWDLPTRGWYLLEGEFIVSSHK